MAKLSVSVPDDLADDLRDAATGNVSAFVATAIRNELDRRRLLTFVGELEEELGPVDEQAVAGYTEHLLRTAAVERAHERGERASRS